MVTHRLPVGVQMLMFIQVTSLHWVFSLVAKIKSYMNITDVEVYTEKVS